MLNVLVIGSDKLTDGLVDTLSQSAVIGACQQVFADDGRFGDALADRAIDTVIYFPRRQSQTGTLPDLEEAGTVFNACTQPELKQVIVLSSAAIYGATAHNPGRISESRLPPRSDRNRIKAGWTEIEALAKKYRRREHAPALTILRLPIVPVRDGTDYFSQLLSGRLAVTLPLHDPPMQLLSLHDLAHAVCCAVEKGEGGIYNVAPAGVIPLRVALRMAGSKRVSLPPPFHRLLRNDPIDQPEYIRYSWVVSGEKIKRELGFVPQHSSVEALMAFLGHDTDGSEKALVFDDFGMDTNYIDAWRRTLFKFLHNFYWRIEVTGIENVPREGRAVLTGVHRGFMPFDGVMLLHLIAERVRRYVRTLAHPCLIKTPFPFNFEKLGGVNAYVENADYVLQRDELLSWFPEGIHGAFTYYRDVYQLGNFGRDEYVKAALRNRAPIVPFVTVGSAEIFPVLAKINWKWWKRLTWWPCFPIAPPFPLLPFPFPSKWHTQFLEPIHVGEQYPPEAAGDLATVQAISQEVKNRMQHAIDDLLRKRKFIFFGSVFNEEEN